MCGDWFTGDKAEHAWLSANNLLFKIIEYCRINNLKSTFYFFGSGTKKKSLQKITLSHKNVFFYNDIANVKFDRVFK